jgi:hypothetical protein
MRKLASQHPQSFVETGPLLVLFLLLLYLCRYPLLSLQQFATKIFQYVLIRLNAKSKPFNLELHLSTSQQTDKPGVSISGIGCGLIPGWIDTDLDWSPGANANANARNTINFISFATVHTFYVSTMIVAILYSKL